MIGTGAKAAAFIKPRLGIRDPHHVGGDEGDAAQEELQPEVEGRHRGHVDHGRSCWSGSSSGCPTAGPASRPCWWRWSDIGGGFLDDQQRSDEGDEAGQQHQCRAAHAELVEQHRARPRRSARNAPVLKTVCQLATRTREFSSGTISESAAR